MNSQTFALEKFSIHDRKLHKSPIDKKSTRYVNRVRTRIQYEHQYQGKACQIPYLRRGIKRYKGRRFGSIVRVIFDNVAPQIRSKVPVGNSKREVTMEIMAAAAAARETR